MSVDYSLQIYHLIGWEFFSLSLHALDNYGYPYTPHTYPLMPTETDALNLINHMKLHINGKKGEERKIEDRKRKEQESAEGISRLKIGTY